MSKQASVDERLVDDVTPQASDVEIEKQEGKVAAAGTAAHLGSDAGRQMDRAPHPTPPISPPHHQRRVHAFGSPVSSTKLRSQSLGQAPIGYYSPISPYAVRSVPVSPVAAAVKPLTMPLRMPFLPPEHSEARKAKQAAATAERKRAKEMAEKEVNLTAEELRDILKKERHRMGRIAADLAALKATAAQSQLEAEMIEEGHINCLLRRMDDLQQEKGRIIVELEREEEMVRRLGRNLCR